MLLSTLNKSRPGLVAVLWLSTLVGAGCGSSGPPLVAVGGKVLLDGAPLPGVMVEFQPVDSGRPSIGYTDDSGRFRLRYSRDKWGALTGRYTVRVDVDYVEGSDYPKPTVKIPKRYNTESTLTHEVVKGKNDVELSLVSDSTAPNKQMSRKTAQR